MKRILYLLFFLSSQMLAANAPLPLPNGSIAPNWTLTDENGVTHSLYDYLDQGKTVFVEFFATWCGICWNYKQANHFKNLYEQYGPNGTDQVRVFMIEGDMSTPQAALYGGSGSVGNWVLGTPYPVIHAPDNSVPSAYLVNSYPTVYAICPDRKAYNIGTAQLNTLVNWIGSCNLDATAQVTNASCAGQNNGSIDLNVTGGTGNINYLWSNGANMQDISGLGTGTYSCTLTDALGRSINRGPFSVSAPQAITAFGQATQPSCHGNDGALAVSAAGGTAPYTYDAGSGPSGNPVITGLSAGIYSVTVTDMNGCEKVVSVEVPQATPPVADAGPDQQITCASPIAPLDGSGSSTGPNINFLWTTSDGLILNPGTLTPSAAAPGTYTITVIDTNTGCVSSDDVIVTADDQVPQITLTPPDTLNCEVTEIPVSAFDLGPCFSYNWTTTDGVIVEVNDNEIIIAAAGSYFLEVTNTCTGCVATAAFNVMEAPELGTPVAEVQDVLCFGEETGTASLTVSGGTPPYAYEWSDGQTGSVAENLAAGAYSATVFDSGGCTAETSIVVGEPDPIQLWVEEVGQASGPAAQDGSILALIDGGVYPYDVELYWNGVLLENPNWTQLAPGDYQIRVVDANGCEYWSETITVSFQSGIFDLNAGLSGRFYPNPASELLVIDWEMLLSAEGEMVVFNSLGQICLAQAVPAHSGQTHLAVEALPEGLYQVVFRVEGAQFHLGQVLISR